MRACVDVTRRIAVVLDATTKERIKLITSGKQLLKLVEDDQRPPSGALMKADRQVKQFTEASRGFGIEPRLDFEPHTTRRNPGTRLQGAYDRYGGATNRSLQAAPVGVLDCDRDVSQRDRSGEIDVDARHPSRLGIPLHSIQQARLPVTTGRG